MNGLASTLHEAQHFTNNINLKTTFLGWLDSHESLCMVCKAYMLLWFVLYNVKNVVVVNIFVLAIEVWLLIKAIRT